MNLHEVERVLERIRLGRPFHMDVYRPPYAAIECIDVRLELETLERDTEKPNRVKHLDTIDWHVAHALKDDFAVLHWVRARLRFLTAHEVDEQLYFDGDRVFDPHRGESV